MSDANARKETETLLARHHAALREHMDVWFERQDVMLKELFAQQERIQELNHLQISRSSRASWSPPRRVSTGSVAVQRKRTLRSERAPMEGRKTKANQNFGRNFLREGMIQRGITVPVSNDEKGKEGKDGIKAKASNTNSRETVVQLQVPQQEGERPTQDEQQEVLVEAGSFENGHAEEDRVAHAIKEVCLPELSQVGSFEEDPTTYERGQRPSFAQIVHSPLFDLACATIIFFNAVLIGCETEFQAQTGKENQAIIGVETFMNFLFVIELGLRIAAARGAKRFFSGPEKGFNIFDAFLVTTSMVDMLLEALNATFGVRTLLMGRILRSFRLLRAVRMLRIVRSLKHIREFRKLVFSLSGSMHTLFWSLLLLVFILYIVAICLTQGVAHYVHQLSEVALGSLTETDLEDLDTRYGGVLRTMYSLFQAVTGGIDWDQIIKPLFKINWLLGGAFLTFAAVTIFGVLNIITSVFVESAVQSQQYYRDLLIQDQMQKKETYVEHVRNIFKSLDEDDSGFVSQEEMAKIFDSVHMQTYLEALEIEAGDARTLFKLLDKDDSDEVDIDEFCNGCLRLKGQAKSFDIFCMIFESERQLTKLGHFMSFCEDQFIALKDMNLYVEKLLRRVDRCEKKLDKSDRSNADDHQDGGKALGGILFPRRQAENVPRCAKFSGSALQPLMLDRDGPAPVPT